MPRPGIRGRRRLAANRGRILVEGRLGLPTVVFEALGTDTPIGGNMSPATIFQLHLVLGYVPWLLCFGAYVWPRLNAMDRLEAQRAIPPLHSFRFFGLLFILPRVVGATLPPGLPPFPAPG